MIYIVACTEPGSELPKAVVEESTATCQLASEPIWLVEIDCTTDELVDMIWPDDEEDSSPVGYGIVTEASAFGGYATQKFWKWAKAHRK